VIPPTSSSSANRRGAHEPLPTVAAPGRESPSHSQGEPITMNTTRARATACAASLALLALAACGDRVENTEAPQAPQAPQASVEINRQGMEGAKDANAAVGVENPGTAPDGNVHRLGAAGDTSVLDPDVLVSEQVKAALAS